MKTNDTNLSIRIFFLYSFSRFMTKTMMLVDWIDIDA